MWNIEDNQFAGRVRRTGGVDISGLPLLRSQSSAVAPGTLYIKVVGRNLQFPHQQSCCFVTQTTRVA